MIKLIRNTANNIRLTLNEKVTIDAPVYFLFRFINDDTQFAKTCLSSDLTNRAIERYNEFVITENDTEAPLTGTLSFETGQYSYEVYAQHSSSNLDYTLANEMVESGRMNVYPTTTTANDTYVPEVEINVYDPTAS